MPQGHGHTGYQGHITGRTAPRPPSHPGVSRFCTCTHEGGAYSVPCQPETNQTLFSVSTDPARIQGPGVPSRTRAKSPPQDCLGLLKIMSSSPHPQTPEVLLGRPQLHHDPFFRALLDLGPSKEEMGQASSRNSWISVPSSTRE